MTNPFLESYQALKTNNNGTKGIKSNNPFVDAYNNIKQSPIVETPTTPTEIIKQPIKENIPIIEQSTEQPQSYNLDTGEFSYKKPSKFNLGESLKEFGKQATIGSLPALWGGIRAITDILAGSIGSGLADINMPTNEGQGLDYTKVKGSDVFKEGLNYALGDILSGSVSKEFKNKYSSKQSINDAAQLYIKSNGIKSDKDIKPEHIITLAGMGIMDLFGDIAASPLMFKGVKALKDAVVYKKVGEVTKNLEPGVSFTNTGKTTIPVSKDLKIVVDKTENIINLKGFAKRWAKPEIIPGDIPIEATKESTNIIQKLISSFGKNAEVITKGSDIIIAPTEQGLNTFTNVIAGIVQPTSKAILLSRDLLSNFDTQSNIDQNIINKAQQDFSIYNEENSKEIINTPEVDLKVVKYPDNKFGYSYNIKTPEKAFTEPFLPTRLFDSEKEAIKEATNNIQEYINNIMPEVKDQTSVAKVFDQVEELNKPVIYHGSRVPIEQIQKEGFKLSERGSMGKAAYFTDNTDIAIEHGDGSNLLKLNPEKFNLLTIDSNEAKTNLLKETGVDNLAEASLKKGYDGFIFTNPNKEIGNTYVIANKQKLDEVITGKKQVEKVVEISRDEVEEKPEIDSKLKEKQLKIIEKNNPAPNEYNTWIRSINDIKSFKEIFGKDFEQIDPDFDVDMINDAIKNNKVTVYSSTPIKNGSFVSPSRMEAESYAGSGKIYTKEVALDDVAWIDETQGQYAKVKSISKEDPLIEEAKKYKSVGEFIKNKMPSKDYITVYHRTNSPLENFGKTPTYSKENANEFFVGNRKNGQIDGYGKNVLELRVKKSDLELNDVFPSGEEHYTINTKKVDEYLKIKSQLTNIWNKAQNIEPQEVVQTVDKEKFNVIEEKKKDNEKAIMLLELKDSPAKYIFGDNIKSIHKITLSDINNPAIIEEFNGVLRRGGEIITLKDGTRISSDLEMPIPNYLDLSEFAVSKNSRGKNIGSYFINTIKKFSDENGIELNIEKITTSAAPFWKKMFPEYDGKDISYRYKPKVETKISKETIDAKIEEEKNNLYDLQENKKALELAEEKYSDLKQKIDDIESVLESSPIRQYGIYKRISKSGEFEGKINDKAYNIDVDLAEAGYQDLNEGKQAVEDYIKMAQKKASYKQEASELLKDIKAIRKGDQGLINEYEGVYKPAPTPEEMEADFMKALEFEGNNKIYGFNPKNLEDLNSRIATKETDKIIKRSEIANEISKKLNVPIRQGKFNRRALGIFKTGPKVIRIKSGGLNTIFHEVGHFLDEEFKFSELLTKEEINNLVQEYGADLSNDPGKARSEAFAEFLRFKLTAQEDKLKEFSPKFNEAFDKRINELPEIKDVLDTATRDFVRWQEQPAQAKILSQLSLKENKSGNIWERISNFLHNAYAWAKDEYHAPDEFSKLAKKKLGEISATEDPIKLIRNFKGWAGKVDLFLEKGTFGKNYWDIVDEKTVMKFKGKSLKDILMPIEKDKNMDKFRVYLTAKRTIELSDREITTGISKADAETAIKELDKTNPEFEQTSKDLYKYQDDVLEYAKESGLIGEEGFKKIKEFNKFRVPFYRVMEESRSSFMGGKKIGGNIGSPIKKIKGSEREIIDPIEGIIKDTYAIINAVERNNIGIAFANLSSKDSELGRLFEKVDRKMVGTKVNVKEVLKKISTDNIPEELTEEIITLFRPTDDLGPNMLNVNMGDKKYTFQVEEDIFKSLQGLDKEDVGMFVKILSIPARLLRTGATLAFDFMFRNPIKDQFTAFVNSKYGFKPGIDLIKGMFELFKKGDVYDLWKAGGGENSMLASMDRKYFKTTLEDLLASKGKKALKYIKSPIQLLRVMSELGEEATRLGEMRRALNAGANPVEAANASREITLDFARVGAKMKALNSMSAFFNANLESNDKTIRVFKTKPLQTLYRVLLAITLPSIWLYMVNRDDPRWKEIPQWQKDLFWIVMTKDHIYRISKPYGIGTIFGSMPERILEYLDTKDSKLFDTLWKSVIDGVVPNPVPNAILTPMENITNYNFFTQRPIVPQGKENLPPKAQYGTYTSEVAKIIGETLNYSPSKIDHLIQGFTAGLGKYIVQSIDAILKGTDIVNVPKTPAKKLEDMPVIKAFMIRNPVGSGSESVNKVYSLYKDINTSYNYVKKLVDDGEIEKAKQYVKDHPELKNRTLINAVVNSFSDINQGRDLIRKSNELSAQEKQIKIEKLDTLQTKSAQKLLDQLK